MQYFRLISVLEGISYLLILSVSLEWISRAYVFPLGAAHGALFVVYLFLSLYAAHKQRWSLLVWLLVFCAALVPFAFLAVEGFIRKTLHKPQPQPSA